MGCLKGDIAGQHAFCPIPNLCKSVSFTVFRFGYQICISWLLVDSSPDWLATAYQPEISAQCQFFVARWAPVSQICIDLKHEFVWPKQPHGAEIPSFQTVMTSTSWEIRLRILTVHPRVCTGMGDLLKGPEPWLSDHPWSLSPRNTQTSEDQCSWQSATYIRFQSWKSTMLWSDCSYEASSIVRSAIVVKNHPLWGTSKPKFAYCVHTN